MSKRFALITPIHGNMPALRAAFHEIDTLHEIDPIYCLGDMIGIGPDTNEVLHALFSRDDVAFVSGNHNEAVLALFNGYEDALIAFLASYARLDAPVPDREFILRVFHGDQL